MTPLPQSLTVRGGLQVNDIGPCRAWLRPLHIIMVRLSQQQKKYKKYGCTWPPGPRLLLAAATAGEKKKKANYLLCAAAPATTAQK